MKKRVISYKKSSKSPRKKSPRKKSPRKKSPRKKSPKKSLVKKLLKFKIDKFHMSKIKIESFPNIEQKKSLTTFPKGYFYTFGKEQCKKYNEDNEIGAKFFYKFDTKNCNILVINTIKKVKKFFLTYKGEEMVLGQIIIPSCCIDWKKVAKKYDGIEFYDPIDYRGIYDDLRLEETTFYYLWKTWGLGVIWNTDNLNVKNVNLPTCIIEPKLELGYESYGSYDDTESEYESF